MERPSNALIHETSPYLLQHAYNPVNWVPWTDSVFEEAKAQNKLVLISVGYSACHWCHVMEHESFENEEVAELMNAHFICVKVDREERPDVDHVYMTAVQLMTQKGGWPLNCFTLPDGRPIYGGTYFPKDQWKHILSSIHYTFKNDLEKALEYAGNLHEGIIQSDLIENAQQIPLFEAERLHELIVRWSRNFDRMEGGDSRAPKFPLPSNYEFLLQYGVRFDHENVLKHVALSLDKMALGGIYDQIGGGFSRYSVDMLWKVPHFEKMLYDNGQLIDLYSTAYAHFKKPLYKRIVYQTIAWLEREMLDESGAFFSALDADSEGEEGKFYCWTKQELEQLLSEKFSWAFDFYSVNQRGYWEEGKYILLRSESDKEFAAKMNWTLEELETNIQQLNAHLLEQRSEKIRPGLDYKCLTSWNALTLKGLCKAYAQFEETEFLYLALKNARWIQKHQLTSEGKLWRKYHAGKSEIAGFLDDYAHTIEAFIAVYQITFDAVWLKEAEKMCAYVLEHFQDETSKMFFFTEKSSTLIARKMEINDNVIPASNSVMAHSLFDLGKLSHQASFIKIAEQQLANVYDGMENYGSGYSNWARLAFKFIDPFYTLDFSGEAALELSNKVKKHYLPGTIFTFTAAENTPAKCNVCYEGTCLMPTDDVSKILELIQQNSNR
jgi:uncharacterized protein YyaL (SSP411 family)